MWAHQRTERNSLGVLRLLTPAALTGQRPAGLIEHAQEYMSQPVSEGHPPPYHQPCTLHNKREEKERHPRLPYGRGFHYKRAESARHHFFPLSAMIPPFPQRPPTTVLLGMLSDRASTAGRDGVSCLFFACCVFLYVLYIYIKFIAWRGNGNRGTAVVVVKRGWVLLGQRPIGLACECACIYVCVCCGTKIRRLDERPCLLSLWLCDAVRCCEVCCEAL